MFLNWKVGNECIKNGYKRLFGFSFLKLDKEDLLKKDLITQSGFAPLRIDMLNDLDRVSFKDAWENKKIVSFENVPINFIGYNDLLIVK